MKMSTRTPPVRMAIACLVVWLVLVATALVPARADADERANREKFEILLAERIANGHVPSTELDRLVWVDIETRELLVTEAKRRGLDSRRAVRKDLEQAEQALERGVIGRHRIVEPGDVIDHEAAWQAPQRLEALGKSA